MQLFASPDSDWRLPRTSVTVSVEKHSVLKWVVPVAHEGWQIPWQVDELFCLLRRTANVRELALFFAAQIACARMS